MEKILITGGSGFIGSHLVKHLVSQNKSVAVLGRSIKKNVSSYTWNIESGYLDENAFQEKDTIIHLAGAGIADERWTKSYKQKIIDSRVKSAALLFEKLKTHKHNVTTFISASAIGYYGETGDVWAEETFHSKEDFLGITCTEWERAARQFETLGIRVVIFRLGLILSPTGGALPVLAKPVKLYVGAPLGSGKQYMSWIHIEDVCRLFTFAIDNRKLNGVYNAVAPGPVTNHDFTTYLGKALHRPVWPINVPSFLLRLILGEKASIALEGQRVSSEKIRLAGFEFKHLDLAQVLNRIY